MKKLFLSVIILFIAVDITEAQLRQDLSPYHDEYSATLMHESSGSSMIGDWMNMLNMTMGHSYSMTFSNFGGQMQNMNAYTNHMRFDISEKLDARFDVSLLHAPFGNSYLSGINDFGAKIIIDQASLHYQLSPNTNISIQFSQRPGYYSNSPFGMSGFRSSHHNRPYHGY